MNTCGNCGGPGALLGTLGDLDWFRCVWCGLEFSRNEKDRPNHAECADCGEVYHPDYAFNTCQCGGTIEGRL